MSEVLTGNSANVTTPLGATVTALSSGSGGTIRVTTSAPHLYGSSDLVLVQAGSTDGIFTINVIDSTHYDLLGTTFVSGGSGTSSDLSLTPQIQFPTDGDTFSQQLSGALSGAQALCDRTQYLQAEVALVYAALNGGALSGLSQSVDFYQAGSPPGIVNLYSGAGYDTVTKKWLIAGNTLAGGTGDVAIVTGRNEPTAWRNLLSASAFSGIPINCCRGMEATSPANKYVYVGVVTSLNVPTVYRADTNANAWAFSLPAGAVGDASDCRVSTVQGAVIAAIGAGTSDSNVYYSTNSGGTWTAQVSLSIGVTVEAWLVAQSVPGGGTLMFFPVVTASSQRYLTTTDGVTWIAKPAIVYTSGNPETPTALVYGADDHGVACWILSTATQDLRSWTYRSYDGNQWHHFDNDLSTGIVLINMQSIGQLITAVVDESTPQRVVHSVNGGVNWSLNMTQLESNLGLSGAASPNGVMYVTGKYFVPSMTYGASTGQGVQ